MMRTKHKFYVLALNVLATLTLGGVVGIVFTQTASAAPAIPLTATPEAAQASVEHWCGRDPSSFDCEQAKKHQRVVLQALGERKSQGKSQGETQEKNLARQNSATATNDENRKTLKQLRAEYLDLFQKNQEMKKAKSALENKKSALNRKNRELKNQASQSCAVASQPSNSIKSSAAPEYVPFSGELSGPEDQGTSSLSGTAK